MMYCADYDNLGEPLLFCSLSRKEPQTDLPCRRFAGDPFKDVSGHFFII